MGDWEIGGLGDWEIGRLGDWGIGGLGDCGCVITFWLFSCPLSVTTYKIIKLSDEVPLPRFVLFL